jgi:predicted Zn-dependent peptidase
MMTKWGLIGVDIGFDVTNSSSTKGISREVAKIEKVVVAVWLSLFEFLAILRPCEKSLSSTKAGRRAPKPFNHTFNFPVSMSSFQKTTLSNGLRVLTETHAGAHSATIGLWFSAGSIYETEREQGLAHLLEHMLFKGTLRRSMTQIAAKMDVLGGGMNAFTEREFVCYHVKVLSEQLPEALKLLCEFVTQPLFDTQLLEIEKSVVLEEIRAGEDEPDELVEDLFVANLWEKSNWGRSIIGLPETVSQLSTNDLRDYMKRHYAPNRCVVVAVGEVQHDKVVKLASKLLADLPGGEGKSAELPGEPKVASHQVIRRDDTECAHLIIGTRAYNYDDPKRYAAWALDTILTGGYSSRLFQEVREKRGLCYSIGGLSASYRTAGFWAVETSVAPENAAKTTKLIARELRRVKNDGVRASELKRAKQMARVNILLAEESASAKMSRLARHELYFGAQKSTEESLALIENVSLEGVIEVAREMFVPELMNLAAIGPIPEREELLIEL